MATQTTSPDRWARFLEDRAPGLTWLAATLLEWAELLPAAQRAWRVSAARNVNGDVGAIAAFHVESGVLAVASSPGFPPPIFANPEAVRRVIGAPEAVASAFEMNPMLAIRRLPGERRRVMSFTNPAPERPEGVRKARPDEWEELERMRSEAQFDVEPVAPEDLAGAAKRGLVWVLERDGRVVGMFRVAGLGRRRVQVADLCVTRAARGQGVGQALMLAAASVARSEYAVEVVMTVPPDGPAEHAATGAGYVVISEEDDVRLA